MVETEIPERARETRDRIQEVILVDIQTTVALSSTLLSTS